MRAVKLSPSDFAFLLKECPRCYYNKYVHGIRRPFAPMAKVFHVIDEGMQKFLLNRDLREISPKLPAVKFTMANGYCTSKAVPFEDLGIQLYVNGRYDVVGERLDGEGFVVGDGKTSFVKPEYVELYSRQLHSYALALSLNAEGSQRLHPITKLGLVVFEPEVFEAEDEGASLQGKFAWQEIPMDKHWFNRQLRSIAELLTRPEAPPPGPDCSYCAYVSEVDAKNLIPSHSAPV